jgi:glycosyltransferase involved in cell wall biosynthesis
MTDAPASAPRALAPFSSIGADHPFAAGLDRFAAHVGPPLVGAWLGIDPDRPVVALVGRISEQKGQDDRVRALPAELAAHPDALVLLVSSVAKEALVEPLLELARAGGVEDAVRFTGYVDDMPALYVAIDVLAAPSRGEGFAHAFSWDRSAERLAGIHDDVLATR